ncbi:hypothetical protein F5Y17DRAFT_327837 [Xylariaceae sp. FL0594]|nr:hypothetical protein F5Y17DRAFT_327837 [Xylariaceae sp. FL0594]
MATIEPRLIHLLNYSTTPKLPNVELPPIKHLPYPQTASRPHPIESEATSAAQRPGGLEFSGTQVACQPIPPPYSLTDDGLANPIPGKDISGYAASALHVLRTDDYYTDNLDDTSTKKRPVKEDFPQLPQPLKKQRATEYLVPPMIVGLVEPPSNAALLPPISSSSFDDRSLVEHRPLGISSLQETPGLIDQSGIISPPIGSDQLPAGKVKRRPAKPRRKWSEKETSDLLLGVSKHGVGKWTDILGDPNFHFNDRTAGDLKDRFRTCCPEELRGSTSHKGNDGAEHPTASKTQKKAKKGLMSENILNDTEEEVDFRNNPQGNPGSDLPPKQRKSRAHRKNLEDLAGLGIKGPFKKSQRRERRPFSDRDDREILQGFEKYGPHWTKIQRDPSFHLSSRQPTDLRDRLRNKYPQKFVGIEKTSLHVPSNNLLEPSVNMAMQNSLDQSTTSRFESQLNRAGSRDDTSRWSLPAGGQEIGTLGGNDSGSGFPSGEMDISRLLLDGSQITGEPLPTDRRGFG